MSPDTAISTPAGAMSDRALDEAHRLLGAIKLAIRRRVEWRPILARMEMADVVTSRRVSPEHQAACEALKPYNLRIDDLLAEMLRRQDERSRARNKNRRPAG